MKSLPSWFRRRVPVVRQASLTECSAACLTMILRFWGRETELAECSERLATGRDGATAGALARAGRGFGLRVQGYTVEPDHLERLPMPLIAHWRFAHFVIVERIGPRWAWLVDPTVGRRRISRRELDEGLTGVVLTAEPGDAFERRRKGGRSAWRRFASGLFALPGAKAACAQILAASLVLQLLGLAVPLLTKVLVDDVLPREMPGALAVVGLGVGVWVAALAVIGLLRSLLLIYLQARLDARLTIGFFEHLLALPFSFFARRATGDLMMRLSSNSLLRELLTNQSLSLILDTGFALVYLALLCAVSPPFGALAAAFGVAQVALLVATHRSMHEHMLRDVMADSEHQSHLVEAIKGIATVKAAGAEQRVLQAWTGLFNRHLETSVARGRFSAKVDTVLSALRAGAPLALLWLGARMVLAGDLSLGTMLGLVALAGSFLTPLASLVASGRQLQTAGVHLERIADVLDRDAEQTTDRATPGRLLGAVEVERVRFRYTDETPEVLRGVSFSAEPGQTVAIVGASGSGKSTLASILLGLHPPTAGEVRFDGQPLGALDLAGLRSQIGSVLQESYLFSGSVRSNIAFNDPDLPLDRVAEAARLAAVDDVVDAMPMGYETPIQEGGRALSGGERQRLSIARAVAGRPPILILDEATSQLDTATEDRVAAGIASLGATRVVIAHRLSTIRQADQILVLERGEVVERGDHEELMSGGGPYASMVRRQERRGPHSAHSPTNLENTHSGLTAADRS